MSFGEVLIKYRDRLLRVLSLLGEFLERRDPSSLRRAAELFMNAGNETYSALLAHNHAILAAVSLEAGARLRERAAEIMRRGLEESDVEYVSDIYDLFRTILDAIGSGQYEESYKIMMEKRSRRAC